MMCHEILCYSTCMIFQCCDVESRMLWYVWNFNSMLYFRLCCTSSVFIDCIIAQLFIKFLTSLFLSHMPLDTTCWPELLLWRHHCHKPTKFPCKVFLAYLDSSPVRTTKDLTCLKSRKKLTSDYFYNQEKHDMIRMIVSNYRLIH